MCETFLRKMTIPTKRNRTLPTAMFLLVLAIVAVAIVYSAINNAPWSWPVPEEAKQLKNPLQPTAQGLKSARAEYADKCAHCHGDTGKGKRMSEATDGELFYKISEGKKPMPVFKNKLTEDQRWELVLLIRSFAEAAQAPNKAPK